MMPKRFRRVPKPESALVRIGIGRTIALFSEAVDLEMPPFIDDAVI
jgi:hypothetical protein